MEYERLEAALRGVEPPFAVVDLLAFDHNAGDLTRRARGKPLRVATKSVRCRALLLDLTNLEFFGIAGFSALHRISVSCARAGIGWALVPSAAVSLLLRICDPDGLLPAVDTVSTALARLHGSASNADHSENDV